MRECDEIISQIAGWRQYDWKTKWMQKSIIKKSASVWIVSTSGVNKKMNS